MNKRVLVTGVGGGIGQSGYKGGSYTTKGGSTINYKGASAGVSAQSAAASSAERTIFLCKVNSLARLGAKGTPQGGCRSGSMIYGNSTGIRGSILHTRSQNRDRRED